MISNYSTLKEKYKEQVRQSSYTDIMIETLASMFTYDGFPETVDVDMMERYLLLGGMVGFYMDYNVGGVIATMVTEGGAPDVYGHGTTPITTTLNGQNKTWNNTDGLVIGLNNNLRQPDLNIERFADMLSKVDMSIVYNVLYSRLLPMPTAKTQQQKNQLDKAIKSMMTGDLSVILSDNILQEIETGTSGIEIVNISDVNASDKIQYLAHFHDDLTRWFYEINGMCTQGSGKMAQQTTDEINGGLSASFIIPLDRLRHRQKMVEDFNKEFGTSVTVRFSDAWLTQWNRTVLDEQPNDNGEDMLDGTADDDVEKGEENE